MQRILKNDLHLVPFKKRKSHGLSNEQKIAGLIKSKALLQRHEDESVKQIVFSNEKLFVVEEKLNVQNNRIYALSVEDIPERVPTVQRFQKSGSVMVWAGVSHNGKISAEIR